MDMKELTQKSTQELQRLVNDLQTQIRDGRFQLATRQVTKLKSVRQAKKDLARILTILSQREKTTV